MLKKAMIMAAGVGSRLEPLTKAMPKPLVPIANIPVMDILINHLVSFGIKKFIANTYYKAEDIQARYKNKDIDIEFIKEKELSGTAGGVKKCQFFFDKNDDFIVMSGDGLTDLDINKAFESHKKSGAVITIVTKEVEHKEVSKYGIIVTDEQGFVSSFQEKPSLQDAKSNLANTGIYIFNYKIFDYIPENTFFDFAKNVFPYVLSSGEKINTYKHNGYWSDIGSLSQYTESNKDITLGKVKCFLPKTCKCENGVYIKGNNCEISNKSDIIGNCIIGNSCVIGENSKIINSILWDNVEVCDNVIIENSIIMSDIIIKKSKQNEITENEI